jgi:peroxiredoxin (alkyl hydroperoxide reductase subunit C)
MSLANIRRATPQYQTEILAFNEKLSDFAALNTEVLAVSTDSEFSHLAWSNTKREAGGLGPNLKLKLLADKNMKISRDYGVLLEVSSSFRRLIPVCTNS